MASGPAHGSILAVWGQVQWGASCLGLSPRGDGRMPVMTQKGPDDT